MMLEMMKKDEFDQVFSLMERSFPTDEYRSYKEQKALLERPEYRIYVLHGIKHTDIRAFLAIWNLSDFTFLEHFASAPEVRGQGLGSAALREAGRLFSGQICLEVELPETEIAKRRIAFYERNGFYLNDNLYFQPPISKGKQKIPLMIMTSAGRVGKERFAEIRDRLFREVYQISCAEVLDKNANNQWRKIYGIKETGI